jgi:hypothetical protein
MPVETRKRNRSSMDEDGPKQTPDEALKAAEEKVKRSRVEAKDKKADASVADLTRLFGHMGGKKSRTRKQKRKGKKRGGDDPTEIDRCEAKVKELERALSNLRAVVGVGGRTRKRKH